MQGPKLIQASIKSQFWESVRSYSRVDMQILSGVVAIVFLLFDNQFRS